tara:strand:- start:4955 stop:5344 length:390 start_codon:yes stop_codon:yes gene_type:complete
MKLITPELERRFAEVGDQSELKNPRIIAKFFSPVGAATWLASEYNPENNICFGYVQNLVPSENGIFDEWGYFSIDELENLELPFGLNIERDIHFNEKTFKEVLNQKYQKRDFEIEKLKDNKKLSEELER